MNLFIGCNFSLPSLYKALVYLIKSETDCLGKKSGTIADLWTYISILHSVYSCFYMEITSKTQIFQTNK